MRPVLTALLVVPLTVALMEAVAWATHKHLMHGRGWGWHASHHAKRQGLLEKNDLYALVFIVLACAILVRGMMAPGILYWLGMGMTVYGVLYFVLHDGLVHRRWPLRFAPRHPYLRRLIQAHHLHHATHGREGAVSFGFLYAPPVPRLVQALRRRSRDCPPS